MKNINKYLLFAISYVLNALGNALMVKGSIGAIVWTSTFENVAAFFSISVGTATTIISIIMYTISKIIGKDFNIKDTTICILLSALFGSLIDMFLYIIGSTPSANILVNYAYGISGVLIIAMCVSLAIYANVAYLALDDFLKNLRNHVFKGRVVIATITSLTIGFIIAMVFGTLYGEVLNMTILTIVASLSLGKLIDIFDIIFGFKK